MGCFGKDDRWWMNMWGGEAIAEEWMKNFGMPREQFEALADELSPCISPDPSSARMGLSVEKELGITLHLLKDTGSITVTASAFGVSAPTVSKTIRSVCNAVNTNLGPRYLKLPSSIKQSTYLRKWFGFPQVLGAVDGRDIAINEPTEDTQVISLTKLSIFFMCKQYVMQREHFLMLKFGGLGLEHTCCQGFCQLKYQ